MWVRESSLALADLIRLNVTRLKQFDVHKLFSHNDQAKHFFLCLIQYLKKTEK